MAAPVALTVIDQVEQSPAVQMLDGRASALMELLPDEAAALRFRRVVTQALVKNPDLLNCTPESVVQSVFEAAAMGLEPTGAVGGAHLVPYNVKVSKNPDRWEKRAQLIPDYRGIIGLVTRPDSPIASMEARVVKEGDEFAYELGSDAWVRHVPSLAPGRSAKVTTHVYSIARLRAGGPPLVDVEDRAGIERVQKRGRGDGFSPWASDWDEMGKKTIIKRHSKVLPVRPEIRSILLREDELADPEPAVVREPQGPTRAARLADKLRGDEEGQFHAPATWKQPTSIPASAPQTAPDAAETVDVVELPADIPDAPVVAPATLCGVPSPYADGDRCELPKGHEGRNHATLKPDRSPMAKWPVSA